MSNLGKTKKYLTKSEVENRIKELLTQNEISLIQQKEQNFLQKVKIEKLQKEILDLKKREKLISNALFDATEKSKQAFELTKSKREEELQRLGEFSAKWSVLLSQKLPVSEVKIFSNEFNEIVSAFHLGIGKAELERKKELEKARQEMNKANQAMQSSQKDIEKRYSLVIEKFEKQKTSPKSKTFKFDLDEALNPTSSLEDIMKDIFVKKTK